MAFDAVKAKETFSTLTREEKYVKLITILGELKESSPIFFDLYRSTKILDTAMEDKTMESYYSVIMTNINALDQHHIAVLERGMRKQKELEKSNHEQEATDADTLLQSL